MVAEGKRRSEDVHSRVFDQDCPSLYLPLSSSMRPSHCCTMAIAPSFLLALLLFFFLLFLLTKTSIFQCLLASFKTFEERCHLHILYRVPQLATARRPNPLFDKVRLYLSSLPSFENDAVPTALLSGVSHNDIVLTPDVAAGPIPDTFLGASISWSYQSDTRGDGASWVLKIRKKDKKRILKPYLEKVLASAQEKKILLHYFNVSVDGRSSWLSSSCSSLATMDTVVMDGELKNKVKTDLDIFVKSRQYYHRVGRVWKRSYLIYGGPGTGKSTFVAAVANFLSFDVYDLDLSSVRNDGDLKELMMKTTSRSLIVMGLERYIAEWSTGSVSGVSMAGLSSLMDGTLAGGCGEERVMIFTITDMEKRGMEDYLKQFDPELTRRIDVRIEFPGCDTFSVFKGMVSNYLGVKEHKLFQQIEEICRNGAKITPAEMGEIMMSNRGSPSRALKSVMAALGYKAVRPPSVGGEVEIVEETGGLPNRENDSSTRENGGLYRLFRGGSRRKTDDTTS